MISGNDEAGAAIASRGQMKNRSNGVKNRLDPADRPVHDWYRFVLSLLQRQISEIRIAIGKHCRLVSADEVSPDDLTQL